MCPFCEGTSTLLTRLDAGARVTAQNSINNPGLKTFGADHTIGLAQHGVRIFLAGQGQELIIALRLNDGSSASIKGLANWLVGGLNMADSLLAIQAILT